MGKRKNGSNTITRHPTYSVEKTINTYDESEKGDVDAPPPSSDDSSVIKTVTSLDSQQNNHLLLGQKYGRWLFFYTIY